jgi:hypothetical protein
MKDQGRISPQEAAEAEASLKEGRGHTHESLMAALLWHFMDHGLQVSKEGEEGVDTRALSGPLKSDVQMQEEIPEQSHKSGQVQNPAKHSQQQQVDKQQRRPEVSVPGKHMLPLSQ